MKLLWVGDHVRFFDERSRQTHTGNYTTSVYSLGSHRLKIVTVEGWAMGFIWTKLGWQPFSGDEIYDKEEAKRVILERAIKFIDNFPPGDLEG